MNMPPDPEKREATDAVASGSASMRLREQIRAIAEGIPKPEHYGMSCAHGVRALYICQKCLLERAAAARELVLYDTLDRFSAAVERLAKVLDTGGSAASEKDPA